MGTTRIKVIDLSSDKKEIKTARKHAEKLTGVVKLKGTKSTESTKGTKGKDEAPEEVTKDQQVSPQKQTPPPSPADQDPRTSSTSRTSRTSTHHHHLGKKYNQATQLIDRTKLYSPQEALDLLAKTSYVKFDPTVEIHLNVADKNINGKVNLPHPIAKKKEKKILVFSDPPPKTQATAGQNIIAGDDTTIEEISSGKLKPSRDFDAVFSTPKFMPQLAKIAKILGPAGLMPNPKNGTVIEDVSAALKNSSDESLEYKTDPTAAIIHTSLGKLSNKPKDIEENLKTLIFAIGPSKIKKATLTSTMGPPIKIDIGTISK